MKFDSCFWKEWYGVDHKGLANAVQNFLKHNYEDKEGDEALNLQWMSPLAAQHTISIAKRVPEI